MKRFRKLLDLRPAERRLLLITLFLVASIRLALSVLSFQKFQRLLTWATEKMPFFSCSRQITSARLGWAVRVASRYVPGATCLTQAFSTFILFFRNGFPARLCIGVKIGETGRFNAHAWVASEDKIVIGYLTDLTDYRPILRFDKQGFPCSTSHRSGQMQGRLVRSSCMSRKSGMNSDR